MQLSQDDTITLFQCPSCGQRGSVPTDVLQKALADTPNVRISCTNCPTKFSPLSEAVAPQETAIEKTPATPIDETPAPDMPNSDLPGSDVAETDTPQTDATDDQSIIEAIKSDMTQQAETVEAEAPFVDDKTSADTAPEPDTLPREAEDSGIAAADFSDDDSDGSLPEWLRPKPKKPAEPKEAATADTDDISEAEIDAEAERETEYEGGPQAEMAAENTPDTDMADNAPEQEVHEEDEGTEDTPPTETARDVETETAAQTAPLRAAGLDTPQLIEEALALEETPTSAVSALQAAQTPEADQQAAAVVEKWNEWQEEADAQDAEGAQDITAYRQPVDLLNAVQLVLLSIVALLFAFSGFILLTTL